MKGIRNLVVTVAMVCLACVVMGGAFLHFNPLCGEELIGSEGSPDGKYVADSYERGCGATTGFVYHVNLRNKSERQSPGFFDGTIKDGEVFVSGNKVMRAEWVGDRELKITCTNKPGYIRMSWENVRIVYSDGTTPSTGEK